MLSRSRRDCPTQPGKSEAQRRWWHPAGHCTNFDIEVGRVALTSLPIQLPSTLVSEVAETKSTMSADEAECAVDCWSGRSYIDSRVVPVGKGAYAW